jgi:hypothetical protein
MLVFMHFTKIGRATATGSSSVSNSRSAMMILWLSEEPYSVLESFTTFRKSLTICREGKISYYYMSIFA